MGEDAHEDRATTGRPRLTADRRAAVLLKLKLLGDEIQGPDPLSLVELVEDTLELAQKHWPQIDESLSDFVPQHLRAAFDAHEDQCRRELRKLAGQARKLQRLMPVPQGLLAAEINPFDAALTRLCATSHSASSNEVLGNIRDSIDQLASANLLLQDHEKPGTRPIYNAARLVARASFYYRDLHGLPLNLNFEYTDRKGAKPGSRSRPGDIEARTATVKLAWALIQAFGTGADLAELQTHLRNYQRELEAANRSPRLSDFQLGWLEQESDQLDKPLNRL